MNVYNGESVNKIGFQVTVDSDGNELSVSELLEIVCKNDFFPNIQLYNFIILWSDEDKVYEVVLEDIVGEKDPITRQMVYSNEDFNLIGSVYSHLKRWEGFFNVEKIELFIETIDEDDALNIHQWNVDENQLLLIL